MGATRASARRVRRPTVVGLRASAMRGLLRARSSRRTGPLATVRRRMQSTVLVVNCGSSTVKYQLLAADTGRPLAAGLEEVRTDGHAEAFLRIGAALRRSGALEAGTLSAIGHR